MSLMWKECDALWIAYEDVKRGRMTVQHAFAYVREPNEYEQTTFVVRVGNDLWAEHHFATLDAARLHVESVYALEKS